MIEIQTDIPIPISSKQGTPKYKFGDMKIGHSIGLTAAELERGRIAAAQWKRRYPGWNYTARRESDGSGRIWRTA